MIWVLLKVSKRCEIENPRSLDFKIWNNSKFHFRTQDPRRWLGFSLNSNLVMNYTSTHVLRNSNIVVYFKNHNIWCRPGIICKIFQTIYLPHSKWAALQWTGNRNSKHEHEADSSWPEWDYKHFSSLTYATIYKIRSSRWFSFFTLNEIVVLKVYQIPTGQKYCN